MPLLRITSLRHGRTPPQKIALAGALTDVLLIAEVGAATAEGREVAHILFAEIDEQAGWFVNGEPRTNGTGHPGHLIFDVIFPAGAGDKSAKSYLHAAINEAAVRILLGEDAPPNSLPNWVFVHDVPEGSWGSRGRTIGVRDIVSGDQVPQSKIAHFELLPAAERRMEQAYGHPDSANA